MNFLSVNIFFCVVFSLQSTFAEWQFMRPKIPPLEYPSDKMRAAPLIFTMKQRINHFSWNNLRTFNMRYSLNNQFYNGSGPMFLFLSGENYLEQVLGYLYTGLMVEIANQTGAAMYMLEHRFYGESVPNGNLRVLNMRNLRVKQALADIAEFIKSTKASDSGLGKVIVFGGSYTASLAAWARKTYPDLIDGAIASSGIYNNQIDNYQYLEGFQKDVEPYPNCSSTIKNGVQTLYQKLRSNTQSNQVAKDLNMSTASTSLGSTFPFFRQAIFNSIIVTMSSQAQYDRIANYSVAWMCGNLTYNSSQLDDYTRLANYYVKLRNESSSENATRAANSNRAWSYQVCTELGNFVTTTSQNQPFYNMVPLSFWRKVCTLQFTPLSSLSTNRNVKQLVKAYGGTNINVTRVVFVGGTLDPWNALGMQKDVNSESPAIVIEGTSHCAILLPAKRIDTTEDAAARVRITQLVKQWIK